MSEQQPTLTLDVHREDSLLVGTVKGALTRAVLEDVSARLVGKPEYQDIVRVLWDFREASLEAFQTADLRGMAASIAQQSGDVQRKLAFLVANDRDFGIIRQWTVYAGETAPHTRRVFREMEDARAWLLGVVA